MLVITSAYAAALAVVFIVLMLAVIQVRATTGIGLAYGGNVTLLERDRRYANFVETVPIALLLMALAELAGGGAVVLNAIGGLLLLGRVLHPFGMVNDRPAHPLRIAGTLSTQASVVLAAGYLVTVGLTG